MSKGGDAQIYQGMEMEARGWELAQANKRPDAITYTMPKEVEDAAKLYSGMYQGGLPGEDIIRDQMGAAYGEGARANERAADSSAGLLGANTNLFGRYMNAVKDLGVQSAQARITNKQNYINANANMALTKADYREREWDVNVNRPYQEKQQEYWYNKQMADQMMWGGADRQTAGAITNQQANMQWAQMATSLFNPLGMLSGLGGGANTAGVAQPGAGGVATPSVPVTFGGPQAPAPAPIIK